MKGKEPAWIKCPDCLEEYACTIHGGHAADCTCPGIEAWADAGHCPYTDPVNPKIKKWVEENPMQEDD